MKVVDSQESETTTYHWSCPHCSSSESTVEENTYCKEGENGQMELLSMCTECGEVSIIYQRFKNL